MRTNRQAVAIWIVFVRQKHCCWAVPATLWRAVKRNVPMAGGTIAAISAIRSFEITPGPLGMFEIRPNAGAPHPTAKRRFMNAADAADFYSRSMGRYHEGGCASLSMFSFPVRNPDILDLSGVLEKPTAFGEFRIEPVDCATFVRPNLF